MIRPVAHPQVERLCRNCEYFDCGGFTIDGFPRSLDGDCHNRSGPHFQTKANWSCDNFFPDSRRWPVDE